MNITIASKLMELYAACPKCGCEVIGNGKGLLECDTAAGFLKQGLFEPERELPKAVLKWRQKKVVILHWPTAPAMGRQIQVVIWQRKTVWVFCAWSVCSCVAPKKCFRRGRRKTLFRRPSVGYT